MDRELARLERARAATPGDPGLRVELARARLRAGRSLGALAVLGPAHAAERELAARALGSELGLRWVGAQGGLDVFQTVPAADNLRYVLVHAGAVLEEPEPAPSGRLPAPDELRRTVVPALLANVALFRMDIAGGWDPISMGRELRPPDRAPTRAEWTKLWRGGRFIDGDESAGVPNPAPDRLLPRGPDDQLASPYGAAFPVGDDSNEACELLQGRLGGHFDRGRGRTVSLATPELRRGWYVHQREVRDVPAHLL